MSHQGKSARVIISLLLDKSEQAFLKDDFGAFRDTMCIPCDVETFFGTRRIHDETELRELFHAVRAHHMKTNVTDMARHVVEAVFKDDNTIVATIETRLLNGNNLTQAPYPVFMVVCREGETWRVQHLTFAIEDQPDHNAVLMGTAIKKTPGAGAPGES